MPANHTPEGPITDGDISAIIFRTFLDETDKPTQLRANYDLHFNGASMNNASRSAILEVADCMASRLSAMGLDIDDAADPRIAGFQRGVEAIRTADPELYTTDRPHITRRPEAVLFSSYCRILSAVDPASTDQIRLRPQMPLEPVDLLPVIARTALEITADPAYTSPHPSYQRKASRVITDVESPFWRFGISTDDYPGRQFGKDGHGPNVTVTMPTGTVTDQSVMRLRQVDKLSNNVWNETFSAGYVPVLVVAQNLRMGVPQPLSDQVDTMNGSVAAFLEKTAKLT